MPRNVISLDPRLTAIARFCGTCRRFADIGTDHGRLGAYLLQTKRCENAQFTDISDQSLQKARRLIGLLGLSDRAAFLVGDGAAALREAPDVAVIAGMGGETIAGIVERGREILADAKLVMQPNVDAPLLRQCLSEQGFALEDEAIVRDGRRLYVILTARKGEMKLTETEANVGPVLMKKRPAELFDYAAFRLRVANKALIGAKRGDGDLAALEREIAIWEEAASWQTQV